VLPGADIGDVQIMLQLLESLGMQIDPAGPSSWRLQASQVGEPN
jgi:hypothetical protein